MTSHRIQAIRERLESALDPVTIDVIDESHLHSGHAGARDGRGHFRVRVVSRHFEGCKALARHQLVFRALDDLMRTDIHALSISALTPAEADTREPDPY